MSIASYPQILCLGDSLTEGAWAIGGYGQLIASEFHGRYDVLNRGYSGYTSRQLLAKLKDDFFAPGDSTDSLVKAVILNISTNDAVHEGMGLQHVPVDETRENLRATVKILQEKLPAAKIMLVTPTIVDPNAWTGFRVGSFRDDPSLFDKPFDRSLENTRKYRDVVLEVANELGLPSVDAWNILESAVKAGQVDSAELLYDGLHLSAKAYGMIHGGIRSVMRSQWSMEGANMEPSFVPWQEYLDGNKLPGK